MSGLFEPQYFDAVASTPEFVRPVLDVGGMVVNVGAYKTPANTWAEAATAAEAVAAAQGGTPVYYPPGSAAGAPMITGLGVSADVYKLFTAAGQIIGGTGAGTGTVTIEHYNVKLFGAAGDGTTDDTAAIQAAIDAAAAASGGPGVVYFPPGQYSISSTLSVGPYSTTSTVPVPYPSIVGAIPPGRIGDTTDMAAVEILCGSSFASGDFALAVYAPNSNVAPSGSEIANLSFHCNGLGAGVYLEQPRMMRPHDLSIDHSVAPSGSPHGATGAFNVVQITGTASAYNAYDHIVTAYAANDGFVHLAADNGVYNSCYDLNAGRYAYNIQGDSRWVACHYEASAQGIYVLGGNPMVSFIGWDFFGVPTGNTVQLSSNGSGHAIEFVGCRLGNNPGASPGEEAGSIIAVQNNGYPVRAQFIGCELAADTNTTDFVYVEAAVVAGSQVEFLNCDMTGTPTTAPFNDASGQGVLHFRDCFGINPVGVVTVSVPTSGTAVAAAGYDRIFYVTTASGTTSCTLAIENGPTVTAIASTAQVLTMFVPAGTTLTPTYAGTAPTWVVEGL